ncbi:glycosyltransferase [Providencia rettgeri]|uniref:glycosyltransferase n=1 Tax=Providencia sp. PROV069 TaxID=2949795 RepID=UPI00234AA4B6|nr:glycosyltransferase [Providencia sp. PROV069]
MKICFVITSLARKGPIIVVQDLVNNYIKSGIIVEIVYFDNIVEVDFPESVKLTRVNFFSRFDFSKYDIVHTHLLRGDIFGAINRRTIKYLISTCHSDFIFDLSISHGKFIGRFVGGIWKFFYKFFDKIVFLTEENQKKYKELTKSTVIYNGRPEPTINNSLNQEYLHSISGKTVIGSCAFITKRKSLEHLIECAEIRKNRNEVYVIVGEGPEKENLIHKAKELNIDTHCIFIPFTDQVYDYIHTFDVFCMTSSSEGMPLSLIEAASMKCPIVSSKIKVVEEMFNSKEATLYDYGDISALDKAISYTLSHKADLSQKVYLTYLKSYTDIKMSNQYLDLYKKLVKNV